MLYLAACLPEPALPTPRVPPPENRVIMEDGNQPAAGAALAASRGANLFVHTHRRGDVRRLLRLPHALRAAAAAAHAGPRGSRLGRRGEPGVEIGREWGMGRV